MAKFTRRGHWRRLADGDVTWVRSHFVDAVATLADNQKNAEIIKQRLLVIARRRELEEQEKLRAAQADVVTLEASIEEDKRATASREKKKKNREQIKLRFTPYGGKYLTFQQAKLLKKRASKVKLKQKEMDGSALDSEAVLKNKRAENRRLRLNQFKKS